MGFEGARLWGPDSGILIHGLYGGEYGPCGSGFRGEAVLKGLYLYTDSTGEDDPCGSGVRV